MPTATAVEKMAADVFESMHMAVHRARNSTVKRGKIFIAQSNDIFGVFDIIAIDPVTGHLYLFQVTRSRGAATARRRNIEKWVEEHDFYEGAFRNMDCGMLIYDTQRNRSDSRRVDRFFYKEHYQWVADEGWHWVKQPPLYITPEGVN